MKNFRTQVDQQLWTHQRLASLTVRGGTEATEDAQQFLWSFSVCYWSKETRWSSLCPSYGRHKALPLGTRY